MTLRDIESPKWHFYVPLDLGCLARDVDFTQDTHLLLETMLYEICRHELSCGMHSGIREAIYVMKSTHKHPVRTTGL